VRAEQPLGGVTVTGERRAQDVGAQRLQPEPVAFDRAAGHGAQDTGPRSRRDRMRAVEQTESLLAVAEIALGLAGFGGIFMALGAGAGARHPADTYRLILLLSTALSTLVLALLPVAFHFLGLAEAPLWRLSSALLAAFLATLLFLVHHLRQRHLEEIRAGEARFVAGVIWVFTFGVMGMAVLDAAGLLGLRPGGAFLVGLLLLVAFGAYLFARMLFLWRG
jgi:hypothetical protein